MSKLQDNKIFEIPDYDGCGIYAIFNMREMKCYIGASRNIRKRAIKHTYALINGKNGNKLLQEDYNRGEKLDFLLICELSDDIEKDDLIAIEKMYMLAAIREYFDIYNLSPKTKLVNQREWLIIDLVGYLMGKYEVEENFVNSFCKKFRTKPGYMKNRMQENRTEFY